MRPHRFDYSALRCHEDDLRFLPLEACAVDGRHGLDGVQSAAQPMKKIASLGNMRGAFNPEGGVRLPEKAPLPASRFSSIERDVDLDRNYPLVSESIFDSHYSKARHSHSEWNSYIPADRFAFSVAGERSLVGRTGGLADRVPRFSAGDYITKAPSLDHVARIRDSSMAAPRRQSSSSSIADSPFSSDIPLSTLSQVVSTNDSDLGLFETYCDPREGGKGRRRTNGSFHQSWAQQTEETYNLQLALTLRLVTEAEITEEPIMLPYHVSETQSVLLSAGSSSVQATSLRFWVNGSLGYADHIRDGFYHVWGMNPHVWALCSNPDEDGGRLPKLDLLKAVDPKLSLMEVVMIDKHTDAHLCELETQAINFSLTSAEPKELAGKLAKLVSESMGGAVTTDLGELTRRWKASSIALKECLNSVVLPIGSISVGVCRHRALLFKVLADCVNLPCRIIRGCKCCGKDDGVSCLILCGNEREFLVDLIAHPGDMCCPQPFLKSLQPSMITSPLRLPEWKPSEVLDNEAIDLPNSVICKKSSDIMNADYSNTEMKEDNDIVKDILDASSGEQAYNKNEILLNATDLSNMKNRRTNHDIDDSMSVQMQLKNMRIAVAEELLPRASNGSPIVNKLVQSLEDNMNITQQHHTEIHSNETRLDFPKPSDIPIRNPKIPEVLLALDGLEIDWEELTIKERVGAGSFGTVHRADWNGSEVAVKVFVEQDFVEERVDEFMREVAILKRTRHPNVVLFMGVVTKRPNFSIVTEYLPRGSLFRLIHRPGMRNQLDERRRIRMALDVARGMNYLHRLNPPIVHRDLKSPNLLVDKTWTVKVCDFGLSRLKMKTFLSSRSAAGTAEWMAPEVLRDEPSNEKSDVYSFGVILWELFTLQQPWSGLSPAQVVGAVGFQQRRPLIPKDVNPDVAALIESCWANDPRQRPSFASIMESLKSLQKVALADATKAPSS